MIVTSSTDGGLRWGRPSMVVNGGEVLPHDKDWIVCDSQYLQPVLWSLLCRMG